MKFIIHDSFSLNIVETMRNHDNHFLLIASEAKRWGLLLHSYGIKKNHSEKNLKKKTLEKKYFEKKNLRK